MYPSILQEFRYDHHGGLRRNNTLVLQKHFGTILLQGPGGRGTKVNFFLPGANMCTGTCSIYQQC